MILIITLIGTQASAISIGTIDSEGRPVYLEKLVEQNPDMFIDNLEKNLRQGNLANVGAIGKPLIVVRPDNRKVQAIYSIYLASKGNLEEAQASLDLLQQTGKRTQFEYYAEAMILQRKQKYKAALKACQQAMQINNMHPYPHNIIGRIYFEQELYHKAFQAFQQTVKLEPTFVPGYTNLGAVSFVQENYQEAAAFFQKAIELFAGSAGSHYGLGLALEALGRYDQAVTALERSSALEPSNIASLEKLGQVQLLVGKYEAALKTGEKLKNLERPLSFEIIGDASLHLGQTDKAITYLSQAPPENMNARYLIGYCYMVKKQYRKALQQMEAVLTADKGHFGAFVASAVLRFNLDQPVTMNKKTAAKWGASIGKLLQFVMGSVRAEEADWRGALQHWQAAEGMISGFSVTGIYEATLKKAAAKDEFKPIALGVLFYFRQLYGESLSQFEKSIGINQNSILGNYWVAQIYLQEGEMQKAIQAYERSIQTAPTFFSALYAIGEMNFRQGKTKTAAEYYERAASVKKDAGLLVRLGVYYENQNDFHKAEKYYKEVIQLLPNWFVGYNQLAWLYTKNEKKLDEALLMVQKADKLQPGNASILDTMGWIYFHKGEYDKALEKLEKAKEANPKNPTILYHLGASHHAKGNASLARNSLKEALAISTDFEYAEATKELLQKIK